MAWIIECDECGCDAPAQDNGAEAGLPDGWRFARSENGSRQICGECAESLKRDDPA